MPSTEFGRHRLAEQRRELELVLRKVDEALAVGDGYFQKKCIDMIRRIKDRGTTIVFCSHAMYYVSAFCQRALWLRQGKVAALGPVDQVVREYENFLLAKSEALSREPVEGRDGEAAGTEPGRAPPTSTRSRPKMRLPRSTSSSTVAPSRGY